MSEPLFIASHWKRTKKSKKEQAIENREPINIASNGKSARG